MIVAFLHALVNLLEFASHGLFVINLDTRAVQIAALSDVVIKLGGINAQLGMHHRALPSVVCVNGLLFQSSLVAHEVFVVSQVLHD